MIFKKLILLVTALMITLSPTLFAKESEKDLLIKNMLVVEINSPITPATLDYLKSATDNLGDDNNSLLVKMNTPGGLVSTTKEIISLFGKSDYPIIVWVTPEGASATSAGAIISSSAHLLYMSEGTNIGAATPIKMDGDIEKKDVRNKAINDLVALVKGLSEVRGRNGAKFGEMISKGSSFSSRDAKKFNIITDITNNEKELISSLNGKLINIKGNPVKLNSTELTLKPFEMSISQSVLAFFANPALAYILFLLGIALLYFEFQAPGGFISGSIGVICLCIAAISFQVLPVNIGAIGLIIISLVLFILEIYITSYGLLALFGLGSFIAGSLLIYKSDDAFLYVNKTMMISSSVGVALAMAMIGYLFLRDMRRPQHKFFSLEGKEGVVMEDLGDNTYSVKVMGERWKAKSEDKLNINDKCVVTGDDKEAITLYVNKL